ncbi:unnamed protein product [Pedinophyceae sp. YPF-701]|nr:unnamed protein product [Pedinophyceae sp. YPF-701]
MSCQVRVAASASVESRASARQPVPSPAAAPLLRCRRAVAGAVAATVVVAMPALASPEEQFANKCVGCHANGGNIVARNATLQLPDLQRNGRDTVDAIYEITYKGKGKMPGFGENCAPKGQCTFGPKLTDGEVRDIAEWILGKAEAGWP